MEKMANNFMKYPIVAFLLIVIYGCKSKNEATSALNSDAEKPKTENNTGAMDYPKQEKAFDIDLKRFTVYLKDICSHRANKPEDCKNEAELVARAIVKIKQKIDLNGGPARFRYGGETCDECASTVTYLWPASFYFRLKSAKTLGYFDTPVGGLGQHVWHNLEFWDNNIKNQQIDGIATIDFWAKKDRFWSPGVNAMGWLPDNE